MKRVGEWILGVLGVMAFLTGVLFVCAAVVM